MNNKNVYLYVFLAILGAYLGHAMGRADREDYSQQQEQIEQFKQKAK